MVLGSPVDFFLPFIHFFPTPLQAYFFSDLFNLHCLLDSQIGTPGYKFQKIETSID